MIRRVFIPPKRITPKLPPRSNRFESMNLSCFKLRFIDSVLISFNGVQRNNECGMRQKRLIHDDRISQPSQDILSISVDYPLSTFTYP